MNAEINTVADLTKDLASRFRSTPSSGATVDPELVDSDLIALERDGYVILEGVLSESDLVAIRSDIDPLLDKTGRNRFEGHTTQRIYSLLNKTRACDRIVDHPRVLALLDRLFLPNYLLSMLQAINILPGEEPQITHADDLFYPIPRPRRPLGAATIWAVDEFTSTNGATEIIPGSHLWGDREPTNNDTRIPVVMPAGSCVFFLGTLWHGGGGNRSNAARLALTAQYCEPWLRPQEAFTLSTTQETCRAVSEDILRMLGYSVFPPFIGQVDGMHPKRLLDSSSDL